MLALLLLLVFDQRARGGPEPLPIGPTPTVGTEDGRRTIGAFVKRGGVGRLR